MLRENREVQPKDVDWVLPIEQEEAREYEALPPTAVRGVRRDTHFFDEQNLYNDFRRESCD